MAGWDLKRMDTNESILEDGDNRRTCFCQGVNYIHLYCHTCSCAAVWWQSSCCTRPPSSGTEGNHSSCAPRGTLLQTAEIHTQAEQDFVFRIMYVQLSKVSWTGHYICLVCLYIPMPNLIANGDLRMGPSCLGSPARTTWPDSAQSSPLVQRQQSQNNK